VQAVHQVEVSVRVSEEWRAGGDLEHWKVFLWRMAGLALAVSLWVLPTRVLQMHTTCRGGAQCVALRMCQRHVQTEICLEGMGAWAVLMTDYSASGFQRCKGSRRTGSCGPLLAWLRLVPWDAAQYAARYATLGMSGLAVAILKAVVCCRSMGIFDPDVGGHGCVLL